MRNITTAIILIVLVSFNLCVTKAMNLEDQSCHQQVELNEHAPRMMWPSFTDNSYIYLLGLFIKQRVSLLKHFFTMAEPAMFRAAILLSQKYNITANGKQFAYRIEETSGRDVIETLDLTCLAIAENQVLGIVGPEYSSEAKTLSRFANRAGLPVIGYSTTDPELSNRHAYQTFYRLPPSDVITTHALLKLFQKYNWNSTNIIYQSDNYGEGGLRALTEVFNNEIKISQTIKYDLFTDRIDDFQYQLEESSSRIVIVWANANITTQIIQLALEIGNILSPSFLWILVAPNKTMHIDDYDHANQLSGMFTIRLVTPSLFDMPTNTELLSSATAIWKEYDPESYPTDESKIDIYGLYAFDAAWLLILAIEKLCQQNPSTCLSFENTSSCFSSKLVNHNELHEIIQTMNFSGVSGPVQFQPNTTDRMDSVIAHYVIDNLQPCPNDKNKLKMVEVLRLNGTTMDIERDSLPQWEETGSTILWPSNSSTPPKGYAVLRNQIINITVYISPPFFMMIPDLNNISQPAGYIPDLIDALQQRMNFKYNYIVASSEHSYDDLVECVENGTYGIVMADLSMSSSRTDKIDFSYPIYDNTMRLVIRKSRRPTISPFAFLKPFSVVLWLLIIFVIYLFSALLIAFYEYPSPIVKKHEDIANKLEDIAKKLEDIANKPEDIAKKPEGIGKKPEDIHQVYKILITIGEYLYHATGALLQGGSEIELKTFFGRFQTVIMWLMSLILIALLTSNMITYFNAQYEKPWLQSIEDLRMCHKVSCNRIGVLENSHSEEYITTEIMNGFEMDYYHLKHTNECYAELLDHNIDVAISDSSSAEYFTQKAGYCQLEVVGLPFGKSYFGVAVPKQWPYKQDLDKNIIDLKLNDVLGRLLEKWFQQKNCDRESEDENNGLGDGLTILEASGLFYIFAILTGLNLIAFGFKHLYSWCRNKDVKISPTVGTAAEPGNEQNQWSQPSLDESHRAPWVIANPLMPQLSVDNIEDTTS